MPTEARPAFVAITGHVEQDTADAARRFAACLRDVSAGEESHPAVVTAASLATRAFGGESEAWPLLVGAVQRLLVAVPDRTAESPPSRRELVAFVAENADLLEA